MITAKKVAKWIWTEFKKEMIIQKPDPATVMAQCYRPETRKERIFSTGMNAAGMVLLICVVMAVWIL